MSKPKKTTTEDSSLRIVKAGDDLTLLEGIDSKSSYVLFENNILTFDDLAIAESTFIKSLMQKYKLDDIDPTTWIQQAQLALEGKFEALEALKAALKKNKIE